MSDLKQHTQEVEPTMVGGVQQVDQNEKQMDSQDVASANIVSFEQSNDAINSGMTTAIEETITNMDYDILSLNKFFSRPIKLGDVAWQVGSPVNLPINAWQLWIEQASVKRKLSNYAYFRGTLKVRVMLNGSPFHYGKLMVAYEPRIRATSDQYVAAAGASSTNAMVYYSQLPHLVLDPNDCADGTLTCPFFYPYDFIKLKDTVAFEMSHFGLITIRDFPNGLQVASADASTAVTVSIFAWMEDVILTGPTDYVYQSRRMKGKKKAKVVEDEYAQDTKLSSVANAVAGAGRELSKVPIIGPFATATADVASFVGGALSFFGLSRPVQIEDDIFTNPKTNSSIAYCVGAETVEKTTFDPKQETTIDDAIAGIGEQEPMLLSTILGRESFAHQFTFASGLGPSEMIGFFDVNPMVSTHGPSENGQTPYFMPSITYGSAPFKYWSGTINYRLEIVASKYHRGRIRMTYDPLGEKPNGSEYNTSYNHVIDLEGERSLQFSVSWMNERPVLPIEDHTDTTRRPIDFGFPPALTAGSNGRIFLHVMNELTSPLATSDVYINLYISAGEDYDLHVINANQMITHMTCDTQFTGPERRLESDSDYEYQSGDFKVTKFVGEPNIDVMHKKRLIFSGDPVMSVRQLLRRYCHALSTTASPATGNAPIVFSVKKFNYPLIGWHNDLGLGETIADTDTTYTGNPTSLFAYFVSSYAGYRGGMRHKIFPIADNYNPRTIEAWRLTGTTNLAAESKSLIRPLLTSEYLNNTAYWTPVENGAAITDCNLQPVLEVEIPYHNNARFIDEPLYLNHNCLANKPTNTFNSQHFEIRLDADSVRSNNNNTEGRIGIRVLSAIAEDFNCIWYLGAPIMYKADTIS